MAGNLIDQITASQKYPWLGSESSQYRFRKKGLPFYRLGTKIFYDPSEIEAWLEKSHRSKNEI